MKLYKALTFHGEQEYYASSLEAASRWARATLEVIARNEEEYWEDADVQVERLEIREPSLDTMIRVLNGVGYVRSREIVEEWELRGKRPVRKKA
jgi:hypothetical protein